MSLETGRQSVPDAPRHPSLLFNGNILRTLEQYRKDVVISFVAATLAAITLLANPLPTKSDSQANAMPETGNNPTTIFWGPGFTENIDPLKIAASFVIVGLLITAVIGDNINEDNDDNK